MIRQSSDIFQLRLAAVQSTVQTAAVVVQYQLLNVLTTQLGHRCKYITHLQKLPVSDTAQIESCGGFCGLQSRLLHLCSRRRFQKSAESSTVGTECRRSAYMFSQEVRTYNTVALGTPLAAYSQAYPLSSSGYVFCLTAVCTAQRQPTQPGPTVSSSLPMFKHAIVCVPPTP